MELSRRHVVEGAGVRRVEEGLGQGFQSAYLIPCVLGDEAKHVGADIEAPKRVQPPIGLDGGEVGVVVVECSVAGSDKLTRDSRPEKDGVNSVLRVRCSIFIKR